MKYEVINISTSTERYIANGVLTHNKFIGGGCPSGTSYITQPLQTIFKKPFIFYQASYSPSLPITVTFTNDTSQEKNYFTYEDSNGVNWCYGTTSYPMTKTFARTGSASNVSSISTSNKMTYIPASFGWQSNFFVSFSVQTLGTTGDGGDFYWSMLISATDNSSRAATNNYPASGFSRVSGGPITVACLTLDSLIEKYDGKTVFLKDIQVGDSLLSINPDTKEYEESIVTSKTHHRVDELYLINNGLLRCSKFHKHVVKRDENWIVVTSEELLVNDILLSKDLEELVISKIDSLN